MNILSVLEGICGQLQQLRQTSSVNKPLQAEDLLLHTVGELAREIGDSDVRAKVDEILQEYRRICRLYYHIGERSIPDYQIVCATSPI